MDLNILKKVHQVFETRKIITDNYVFHLHYKITSFLLFMFAALLTCRQYFGDPIKCISGNPNKPVEKQALDAYCWIFSTFTVNKHHYGKIGKDAIFPGVGESAPNETDVIQQKYYQWVALVLFLQATLFFIPHLIWLLLEGGRLGQVANDLNGSISNPDWNKNRIDGIVHYVTVWKLNQQKSYTLKFAFCEILNFLNVVGQLCALEHLFGGRFVCYGSDLFKMLFSTSNDSDEDIMARIFPKIAKCSFKNYGPSGTVENVEALCVLPLNIFNEKIFGFCYFWFVFVAIVTFIGLLYRASFFETHVRFHLLRNRFEKAMSTKRVNFILSKFDYGDCFFLCQLSKNINPYFFDQLIEEIVKKLESMGPAMDDNDSYFMQYSEDGGEHYSTIRGDRVGHVSGVFKNGSYNVEKANSKISGSFSKAL